MASILHGNAKTTRESHHVVQSMSRRGNCWELAFSRHLRVVQSSHNAVAGSFFATLKKQAVHGEHFLTRQAAQQHVFAYIECYYNRVRRHSSNGWVSPVNFKLAYYKSTEGWVSDFMARSKEKILMHNKYNIACHLDIKKAH